MTPLTPSQPENHADFPVVKHPVAVSREVIEHHIKQHPCGDVPSFNLICPCGDALSICCSGCEGAVFVVTWPGTWCEHAQELYQWGDAA